ncbi:uncharacterized protein LOC127868297 [Dreissena polymorpha]|uniref:uncharacterized protein LOC127868297 n=1 Tax=Dreissena polymorpha TaxID=45954 RepID=UPI002265348D|nr:uncharacterized protein LOC127868297 [Dreissena polymorpha]
MVVLVVMRAKHAPEPEKLGGVIITTIRPEETTTNADNTIPCPDVNVKLQDMIVIKCPDLYSLNHVTKIALKPPLYMNEGKEIRVSIGEQANTSNEWVAVMDATSRLLTIKGPAASCRSTGKYRLHVQASEDMSLYNRTIDINVISEIKKVNISLSQDVTHNSTDYKIGCSTTSGCEQSFVDFFAEINQEEQFLRGVNFSCQITYDDFAGYRVECNGTIPDFLLAQFERITCKPRSKLLDHLNETEKRKLENDFPLVHCNITTHCGFKCKEAGDYYAVDTNRCDIFHRCYERQVYTSYCSPGTFFDPGDCACKHTTDLPWCRSDGGLNPENEITMKTCRTQ